MQEQLKEMGARMKHRRKELHMSQAELAERLGTSNNHISGIETGKQTPSFPIFVDICNELGVRPDYLLCGCMHSDNLAQNIIDTIRLCDERDLETLLALANIFASKNKNNRTDAD